MPQITKGSHVLGVEECVVSQMVEWSRPRELKDNGNSARTVSTKRSACINRLSHYLRGAVT